MIIQPDFEAIQALAYQLWERRGKPLDSADEDWFEAERQLSSQAVSSPSKVIDESIKESFPASDPPSSRLPDEPPANADAKWAAAGVDREELCRDAEASSADDSATVRSDTGTALRPPLRRARVRRMDSRR